MLSLRDSQCPSGAHCITLSKVIYINPNSIMMAETVEDLERRCWELGQKYSHIETINEVYRAEIDRLRDKVNRERGQHARDKEGLKRFHENMAENVKLDNTREMDKRHQEHEAEIGKLKGMQTIRLYFCDRMLI